MSPQPVRYSPDVETPEADEAETNRQLTETLLKISEITFKDSGHAIRSVHAKAHGLLNAELMIADDLPPELAQGLFATPGRYPVLMRFSTIPGDILDDSVSVPRGLAIKIVGVEGETTAGV
jgi:catalase